MVLLFYVLILYVAANAGWLLSSPPLHQISSNGDKTIECSDSDERKTVFHMGLKHQNHDVAGPNKEYLDITWVLFQSLLPTNPNEGREEPVQKVYSIELVSRDRSSKD